MIIDPPNTGEIPALRSIWKEAFGDSDAFLDTFFRTAYSPKRCLIVRIDGRVAAALYWFRCTYNDLPIAYLYAVATAKAYRGQGFCRALLNHTHKNLQTLGFHGTVLVPGSQSLFRFYESLGYCTCSTHHSFSCVAADTAIPLSAVSVSAYATLRRRFLPENSVIQEQENLDLLQTEAAFYAGDKYLLAARKEGDTLRGIELLGDTSVAPGILAALGCTKGTFRTPGEDIPFAMSYSFNTGIPILPSYFGFAFD